MLPEARAARSRPAARRQQTHRRRRRARPLLLRDDVPELEGDCLVCRIMSWMCPAGRSTCSSELLVPARCTRGLEEGGEGGAGMREGARLTAAQESGSLFQRHYTALYG